MTKQPSPEQEQEKRNQLRKDWLNTVFRLTTIFTIVILFSENTMTFLFRIKLVLLVIPSSLVVGYPIARFERWLKRAFVAACIDAADEMSVKKLR